MCVSDSKLKDIKMIPIYVIFGLALTMFLVTLYAHCRYDTPFEMVVFTLFTFGMATGLLVGVSVANAISKDYMKKLNSAGIKELRTHSVVVNGKVSTNWVEIVWMDDGYQKK